MENQLTHFPSDSCGGSPSHPVLFNDLPLLQPEKHRVAEDVTKRFNKLHTRFLEDIEELSTQMSGENSFKIKVGPGGLADVQLHLKY